MKRLLSALALLCAGTVIVCAQNAAPMPIPKQQFLDASGVPLAGGLVYTCVAGSACPGNPLATYTDASGSVQNPNPIVLDAGGYASIWLGPSAYKIVVENALGVVQWTQDNVQNNGLALSQLKCSPLGMACLDAQGFVLQSELNYNRGGASTVNRSIASKLGDTVSALDFAGADLGAQINAAISALGTRCGTIVIPAGVYSFATPINADQTVGCTIVGAGGLTGGAQAAVQLQYTGTATPISARSSSAFRLSGVQLVVNNSGFHGYGIDLSHTGTGCGGGGCDSAFWQIDHDSFYASGSAQYAAVINAQDTIEGTIERNAFGNYIYAIQGAINGNTDYANASLVRGNQFLHSSYTLADIFGPTQGWQITSNTFELAAGTGSVIAFNSTTSCTGCVFAANWIGDVATTSAFNVVNVFGGGWQISGNYVALNAAQTQTAFNIGSGLAGLSLTGNTIQNYACAVNFNGGTPVKDVVILGNNDGGQNAVCGPSPTTGTSSTAGYTAIYNALQILGSSALPASTGSALYLAAGFASPVLGRIYVGDGTGYQLNLAKRSASTDTDLFQFRDSGQLITSGNVTVQSGGLTVQNGGLSITGGATITGTIQNPTIKANSGTRYVCVDTSGNLVSQTTACSGT